MRVWDLFERIASRLAFKMSRKLAMMTFLCFVTSLYFIFALINNSLFHQLPWYRQPGLCVTPKHTLDDMVQLTFAVSNMLTKLNISHTLCYGTLWGALRYGKILKWDNNVDFCVLKSEIQKVPWDTLYETSKASNMDITYNVRHGEYHITHISAKAVLNVFYTTPLGEAFKDGYEHRFLLFFHSNSVSFPSKLIEAPLNEIVFHDRPMPVPHNDMEILKYLYKDDWWLERPPLGCPPTNILKPL